MVEKAARRINMIKIKNLTKKYNDKIAVNNLTLNIKEGELFSLLGVNGAGKTTSISMLSGLIKPTSGEIKIDVDNSLMNVSPQETAVAPNLTVKENLEFIAGIYKINDINRVNELLKKFKLEEVKNQKSKTLSGGYKRRLSIAMSLINNPKILFLDEPTIGLDVNAKLIIRNLLNRLSKEEGTTLFLTSHDMADVEQVCDRMLVLDKGTIAIDSSIKEIKKHYIKKKIVTLTTDVEKLQLDLPGVRTFKSDNFHLVCEIVLDDITIEKVIQEALKRANLKDVTIEDPSMEEIIKQIYSPRN